MPEYTVLAVLSVPVVVALERYRLRTGLFRQPAYWVTMAIVFGFQCLVDGWLTKLDAPIVLYSSTESSGLRFPWDIPVEDFLFGFSLLTSVLLAWEWARLRGRDGSPGTTEHERDRVGVPDRPAGTADAARS